MSRMFAALVGSARREAFAVYERSHAWLRDQQASARAKARARAQVDRGRVHAGSGGARA